jgi:hypothetical protein
LIVSASEKIIIPNKNDDIVLKAVSIQHAISERQQATINMDASNCSLHKLWNRIPNMMNTLIQSVGVLVRT